MKNQVFEREEVLLEFKDPRTGQKNQFLLASYDGDKAGIFWLEQRSTTVIGEKGSVQIMQEWWEKDWWCFDSWGQAKQAITCINGERLWHK